MIKEVKKATFYKRFLANLIDYALVFLAGLGIFVLINRGIIPLGFNDSELRSYDKQHFKGMYLKTGKLHFSIYEKTLEENECDIKRGDYIGIQINPDHIEYFIVTNDGRKNYGNSQTMYGVKPFYRNVECAPVTDNNEIINAQL